MANPQPIRQRVDNTVVHKVGPLDGTTTVGKVKLDVVCHKITIELNGLTADIAGSLDGNTWFSLATGETNQFTYGGVATDHLVKWIRITRTAGTGIAVIVGV